MGLSDSQRRAAHRAGVNALHNYETAAVASHASTSVLKAHQLHELASSFTAIAGTAYFIYLGQVARQETFNKVYFVTATAATGALVQELGVATSPTAPNGAVPELTIRAIDTTAGNYAGATGRYSNSANLAYSPPVGTHIWVFARFQAATTQPLTTTAYGMDQGQGSVVTFASVDEPLVLGQVISDAALVSVTANTGIAPKLALSV